MLKKIVTTSIVVSTMLTFIACSGGDTNNVSENSSNEIATTGTAYYIDSAVAGVNYTCGEQSGITGANGSFTFEIGQSCTFYLGDMELRSVNSSLLKDGKNIYEVDLEIARMLMSLDTDGNPDNGITLNKEIIAALAKAGINSLPDTEEEMDALLKVIEENGGVVVTKDDAQAHLDVTREEAEAAGDTVPTPVPTATPTPSSTPTPTPTPTPQTLESLIVGKTVYQLCGDEVAHMTFQRDGNISMEEEGEIRYTPYRIVGDIIYTTEDGEEKAHTVVIKTTSYIKIDEGNGSFTYFYFSEQAAKNGKSSDCGGDEVTPVNDLVTGDVTFKDDDDKVKTPPSNAWVRIVPSVFKNDNDGYNGLLCKVQGDGTFGTECHVTHDEQKIRDAFANNNETFQIVIYRENGDDPIQWNCGEDAYKFVGDSEPLSSLNGIVVIPSDYSDHSGETCN